MVDQADDSFTPVDEEKTKHVLVVEDNGLIASRIVSIVRSGGYAVAGSGPTLTAAINFFARSSPLDAAVLDIDLRGEQVYPLAEKLRERGVPFLFLTGYETVAIPDRWQHVPRIEKPFEAEALLRALRMLLEGTWPSSSTRPGSATFLTKLDRRSLTAVKTSRELITEAQIIRETYR